MAIVKQTNKRTGLTYAYESHSYRDPETHKPKSRRRLIGRVDDVTGEIIPTRGRRRKSGLDADLDSTSETTAETVQVDILKEKDAIITELRQENRRLLREKEEFLALLGRIAENYRRRSAEDEAGPAENKEH